MTIVPPEYHSVKTAYDGMSKSDLIEIIETQKLRINDLQWHDEIMSNTDLPIAARFAARAVRKFTQTRTPCDDGYYKGFLPAMAELAGVSAPTISRGLQTLSDATDALDKQTDEIRDERGRLEKNVLYFRTYDSFDEAPTLTPTKELPKHGGNRRLPCPECGCVHRRRKVIEECAACSHKFYENEHIIRGDEESFQVEIGSASEEQTDNPESFQVETLSVDTLGIIASCNAIPEALHSRPIWCCHRDKVPYNASKMVRDFQKAKSTDPKTWTTYDQALAIYQDSQSWKQPFDGIGLMCDGSFTVIDYDHCIEDGQLDELTDCRIQGIDSYAEISYSGTGVHQIVLATIPRNIKQPGIEMYDHARFITWTGKQLASTSPKLESRQEAVHSLFAEIAPPAAAPISNVVTSQHCSSSDAEILEHANHDAKYRRLLSGDASDYPPKKDGSPDYSRADAGLIEKFIYYGAGGDVSTIAQLGRHSELYDEKWERPDYLQRTLNFVLRTQERKAS